MIEIKIGIIGFGNHMFEKLIPAIRDCGISYQLIAGCRKSKLESTKTEFNLKYVTANYQDIISDPEINTLVIALPDPSLHEEVVKAGIQAGKHIFVEKPLSKSWEMVAKLAELSKLKKVMTCEGFNLLHLASMPTLKNLINQGSLASLNIFCSIGNSSTKTSLTDNLDVGLYFGLIHAVSVINYLLKTPDTLTATNFDTDGSNYSFEVNYLYTEKKPMVNLKFNTHSKTGFQFIMSSTTKTGETFELNATKKVQGVINEKQKSYVDEFRAFFRSIQSEEYFENSFSHNIETHKILTSISIQLRNLLSQNIRTSQHINEASPAQLLTHQSSLYSASNQANPDSGSVLNSNNNNNNSSRP